MLKLTWWTIILSTNLTKIYLFPERFVVNWYLTIYSLNSYFCTLNNSWVDEFMIILRMEVKVVFNAAKVVDSLMYWYFIRYFLWSKYIYYVLKSWVLRVSFLQYLLFVEIKIIALIDQEIDDHWLTELLGLPTSWFYHFYF